MSANRICFLSTFAGATGRGATSLCVASMANAEAIATDGVATSDAHPSTGAVGMDTGTGVAVGMDTGDVAVTVSGGESVLAPGASTTGSTSASPLSPLVPDDELELLSGSVVRWPLRRRDTIVPSLNW